MRLGAAFTVVVSLFALLPSCIESAKSADVPPASSSSSVVTMPKAKAQDRFPALAQSASRATASAVMPAAASRALAPTQPLGLEPSRDTFFGEPDAEVREALATRPISAIEKGRGGRSLGFRITLEGGQRGYFKAEQTFSAANWFGEVAAYHLDRMLGLGRVAPVVSRQFAWARLEPVAYTDFRKSEIIVRNGQVRGAFVGWVTGALKPLEHVEGWEHWIRIRYWPTTAVTPFQRPAVWKRELDMSRAMGTAFRSKEERLRRRNLHPEPDRPERPAELSDLVVFDYLTRNIDRWGGGNANVLVRGDRGPLIFLDNAAGFEVGDQRPSLMEARLHVLQRFRRRTISAIRAFDLAKYEARLAKEPLQPVLNRVQLDGLEERRKALLEWVSEMEKAYGEAIWAWE
jgi:hypothetical protein